MFHVDCTFEDTRIIASSNDGKIYETTISDKLDGDFRSITLTAKQLGMIFAFNMDNDGEPEGFEQMYKELEPLFTDWPYNLRPIP